ncbi:MAG TPA: hypothetical protein DCM08_13305 [Microscillaceae bacterium]|nr:hypothetical protein [Microscillaceae bacterium]
MFTTDGLAVVILNYNGRNFLKQCLPSVIQHSGQAIIFVADNGSTDDSVAFVQANFPTVRLLTFSKNHGFSAGYNLALQQIKAKWFLLLNSDVEVCADWLAPFEDFIAQHPEIVAFQPKLRTFDNPQYFEYAGAAGGFLDKWGYPFCRGRIFQTLEEDKGQYDEPMYVFWASGAALCVRAEVFFEAGALDADFFAHMEEIDLCWRIQRLGYRVACVPQSTVLHIGAGTLAAQNPHKTYLNIRNNLAMLTKNLPLKQLGLVLLMRLGLDMLWAFYLLVQGKRQQSLAIGKAYLHFYGKFRYWIRKRQQFKQPFLSSDFFYPTSIIGQYFIKKRKYFSSLAELKHFEIPKG